MSAIMVPEWHIHFLVNAGLKLPKESLGPLRWQSRELTDAEREAAYERGEAWGPRAAEIHRSLRRELTPETAGRVGAMLLAENRRSVDHRYDEEEWESPYIFQPIAQSPNPIAVLHAIAGYRYQACEHPEWENSEAYRFCRALEFAAIHALPGYADTPAVIHSLSDVRSASLCCTPLGN